ncbi:uncharacterized protein LOC115629467 [Scaptodrosophila lebanonensis]|uniref:Uncharacterized protein LOC115629467 n=1 Tax=Drosophila lebanonensis TaxID=7225 RepID=A0A6J2U3U5_DROLE|nr:uncharacterized protein LOC115629467 [Scaptodrosophila lebanonensis]
MSKSHPTFDPSQLPTEALDDMLRHLLLKIPPAQRTELMYNPELMEEVVDRAGAALVEHRVRMQAIRRFARENRRMLAELQEGMAKMHSDLDYIRDLKESSQEQVGDMTSRWPTEPDTELEERRTKPNEFESQDETQTDSSEREYSNTESRTSNLLMEEQEYVSNR